MVFTGTGLRAASAVLTLIAPDAQAIMIYLMTSAHTLKPGFSLNPSGCSSTNSFQANLLSTAVEHSHRSPTFVYFSISSSTPQHEDPVFQQGEKSYHIGKWNPVASEDFGKGHCSQDETADKVLEATIQVIQQVTQFVPLDIAKNVLKGITSILMLLQKNIQNKASMMGLARRCDTICSILAQATKDVSMDDISDALNEALRTLKSSIDDLHSDVMKALQHGRVRKLVAYVARNAKPA
ncbi:hypothetical protein JVU11DRAFT_2250 [Chiua virens]|nr:hypothetical protein JVU11DRAFT_2250 [Chiua virens]